MVQGRAVARSQSISARIDSATEAAPCPVLCFAKQQVLLAWAQYSTNTAVLLKWAELVLGSVQSIALYHVDTDTFSVT